MKTITIKSVRLHNFKGARDVTLQFNPQTTVISGRNGSGKTTVADAIFWVLFNKDSNGRTQFGIKTYGVTNEDTYVELTLTAGGREYSLRKTLAAVLSTPTEANRAQGTSAKYNVNGTAMTKGDFTKFISEKIVDEGLFKTISSPTYFLNLDWKEQRQTLEKVFPFDGTPQDERYEAVRNTIREMYDGDAEAYFKHLAYNIKTFDKEIENLTTRISEQRSTLPAEDAEWDMLDLRIGELKDEETSLLKHISDIEKGYDNGKASLYQKQEDIQRLIFEETQKVMRRVKEYNDTIDKEVLQLKSKNEEYEKSRKDISSSCTDYQGQISEADEEIKRQAKVQESIRLEWAERVNAKYSEPEISDVCPTCGQAIPWDKIQEAKDKHKADFNVRKAEAKKELTEKANLTKAIIKTKENLVSKLKSEMLVKQGQLKAIDGYMANINDSIRIKEQSKKTVTDELNADLKIKELRANIEQAKTEIKNLDNAAMPQGDSEAVKKDEARIKEIQAALSVYGGKKSERDRYNVAQMRIDELEEKLHANTSKRAELLREKDEYLDYALEAGKLQEQFVNKHFSMVRFMMYKTLVNGTTEPDCAAYVNGVPYKTNLNTADRLNAGLDVCNAFSKALGVCAPVIIDNAESVIDIMPTDGQQIILKVKDCEFMCD